MPVAITAFYAGILALGLVALGINVTVHRGKLKVPLGDGDHPEMLRMVRIHGNAAEYIPIALLLMGLYELNRGTPLALHATGIALIVGRVLFSWGMWNKAKPAWRGPWLGCATMTATKASSLIQRRHISSQNPPHAAISG